MEKAKSRGHSALLVSGGGQVSAAFLNDHLLDEIFLSVHPIILGQGIRLFAGASFNDGFKLQEARAFGEGLAQLHYKKKP